MPVGLVLSAAGSAGPLFHTLSNPADLVEIHILPGGASDCGSCGVGSDGDAGGGKDGDGSDGGCSDDGGGSNNGKGLHWWWM